ncbi:MAG: hypothetical protein RSE29_01235 [Leclercia sp.]
MSEISTLAILQQLDRQRLKETPYSPHSLMEADENTRRQYCALLFMALMSHSPISEQQHRMLQLWLPAIGMIGKQAEFCQMAVKLGQDGLAEAINAVRDAGGHYCFLLDCLVFSRVNGPLTQQQVTLFEALGQMLAIGQAQMTTIVYITCEVLGITDNKQSQPELKIGVNDISVWREFLDEYIEKLRAELVKWSTENSVTVGPAPFQIKQLELTTQIETYYGRSSLRPFPAGLSLLLNLGRLTFDSQYITSFPDSSVLSRNVHDLLIGGTGRLSEIPDSICQLKKLKRLNITATYLKNISEKVYVFLKENNVEHNIPDSCFIKGPK